jgi:hypothetical protein
MYILDNFDPIDLSDSQKALRQLLTSYIEDIDKKIAKSASNQTEVTKLLEYQTNLKIIHKNLLSSTDEIINRSIATLFD